MGWQLSARGEQWSGGLGRHFIRGRGHVEPRLLSRRSPDREVPPGQVCAVAGGGAWDPEDGRGGPRIRRPEGGPAGARAQAMALTLHPAFFFTYFGAIPAILSLLAQPGTSGPRVRGKICLFFLFLRRLWVFRVFCESLLISGLEKNEE